jgi:hypothetical protein
MPRNPSLPPRLARNSLYKLESQFYEQYGHTLANWAHLEQTLSHLFCELSNLQTGDLGPALFFSGKSFNTRAGLLNAAARAAGLDEPVQEVFRALIKKARQFESTRNAVAHGYPVHAIWDGVDWQGWRIKEGADANEPGGIGLVELKNAAENFSRLELYAGRVRSLVSGWRAGARFPPEEYLKPIRALPNDARLPPEDQTGAEAPWLSQ